MAECLKGWANKSFTIENTESTEVFSVFFVRSVVISFRKPTKLDTLCYGHSPQIDTDELKKDQKA